MRLGELEHAYLACAIYLYLAFTLSATRSGVDHILAQCSLLHQCDAQEVGRAQDDSLPSSDRVLFFYVLFRVLSWWRSYCIQGMRPRYVVWKLRVFNRPNQRGHPRAVSLTPAGLSELFLLYGLLNGITNSARGRANSRWRGATDHSKLPTGHSCCLNSQRGGSERSSSVACQTQE